MAAIDRSVATLRLFGDDLDPEEITRILGKPPTRSERKGEVIRREGTGIERTARTGSWRLEVADRRPEDVDGQVAELLSALTTDVGVWQALASKYKVDLFVGLFMKDSNEGLSLSPTTLTKLGERGISIGFDIYDPS